MIGSAIGPYRVESKLGEGGMGEVWLATDVPLGRKVALKLLPDATQDPARTARFEREARAASALSHPNVCTILGLGQTIDGRHYIAMEYVGGATLRTRLSGAPLSLGDALDIAIQVAAALSAAHAAGIVHRDIKPENVMIRPDGLVKVLDFGLAKLVTPDDASDGRSTDTFLATRVGTVVGTVGYMSPEQAEGKLVDLRSDVFAFGALLYELTCGRPAFRADSIAGTLAAILEKDPPPLPDALPSNLSTLVFRCLRKRPDDRYQDMRDVRITLEEIRDAVGGRRRAPTAATPARLSMAAALWALAGIVIIAAVAWVFLGRRVANEPAYTVVPLTSDAGFEGAPSFSPDGSQVAYSWNGPAQDNFDIYVKQIGAPKPLRLTSDPAEDRFPVFSPDGLSIGFFRLVGGRASYVVMPAVGGSERTVADVPAIPSALSPIAGSWPSAWLPDGRSVVVDGLRVLSLDAGELRPLRDASHEAVTGWFPAVSPDGRTLAFCRPLNANSTEYSLYTIPLTTDGAPGGSPTKLIDMDGDVYGLAWTTDSRQLVFASGALSGTSGILKELSRITAQAGAVPERLPFGQDVTLPAIARRGTRLAFVRNTWAPDIYRGMLPAAGTAAPAERFVSSTRSDWNPQYSPDGRHLAFESNRTGQSAIWMGDADGSNLLEVFSKAGKHSGTPRWSPDSQRIAFDSSAEGTFDIYVIRPGSREPLRVTSDAADDAIPSWSPDGQSLYFMSNRSGRQEIWTVAATGGAAVQITRNGGVCVHPSADGTRIYYTKQDGDSKLWTMPAAGGPEHEVLPSVVNRAFVVFGDGLFYIPRADEHGYAVHHLDLSTGAITRVLPIAGIANLGLSVSPDRRYVLYAQVDAGDSDLMLVDGFR